MFTIKKKPLTPNIIWDDKAGKPLCSFGHKGVLETDNQELAEKLAAMGHTVTEKVDASVQHEHDDNMDEIARNGNDADTVDNMKKDASQQPERAEDAEIADASAQQAAGPATKGKRGGK